MTDATKALFASLLSQVQVTHYDHGGARFFIENEEGRHLFADTYNGGATAFLEEALAKVREAHDA